METPAPLKNDLHMQLHIPTCAAYLPVYPLIIFKCLRDIQKVIIQNCCLFCTFVAPTTNAIWIEKCKQIKYNAVMFSCTYLIKCNQESTILS